MPTWLEHDASLVLKAYGAQPLLSGKGLCLGLVKSKASTLLSSLRYLRRTSSSLDLFLLLRFPRTLRSHLFVIEFCFSLGTAESTRRPLRPTERLPRHVSLYQHPKSNHNERAKSRIDTQRTRMLGKRTMSRNRDCEVMTHDVETVSNRDS